MKQWTIIFQMNGFYEYSYIESPEPFEMTTADIGSWKDKFINGIQFPTYKTEIYQQGDYEIICALEGHQGVIFE